MTMDYEKAYKEALERAKENFPCVNQGGQAILQDIFPELKESEDEKIAKELIRYLPYCDDIAKDTKERWLAWLEKQDKKDSQVIHPKFTSDDILAIESCMQTISKDEELYKQLKSLYGKITDVYWGVKQVEQKPHWKPTKEQIEALNVVRNSHYVEDIFGDDVLY